MGTRLLFQNSMEETLQELLRNQTIYNNRKNQI